MRKVNEKNENPYFYSWSQGLQLILTPPLLLSSLNSSHLKLSLGHIIETYLLESSKVSLFSGMNPWQSCPFQATISYAHPFTVNNGQSTTRRCLSGWPRSVYSSMTKSCKSVCYYLPWLMFNYPCLDGDYFFLLPDPCMPGALSTSGRLSWSWFSSSVAIIF